MKKSFRILSLCIIALLLFLAIYSISMQHILASSSIPFSYNILPQTPNLSIIDTKVQNQLEFKLYEPINTLYYNGKPVNISNNTFQIDISNLSGKATLVFENEEKQSTSFAYYFSDKDGKVADFELVEGENLTTYVTTFKNIKIIYSNQEKATIKRITSYLEKLPDTLLGNVNSITLIPYENTSNIAGVTKGSFITLYKFSQYSTTTQKNILYHEIAHTWANYLMQKKIIDYTYTDYSTFAKADKNFVTSYSEKYTKENNRYSEDFAESVAFFFMNNRSFQKKYPYRFEYIESLLKTKIEEKKEEENK